MPDTIKISVISKKTHVHGNVSRRKKTVTKNATKATITVLLTATGRIASKVVTLKDVT